MVLLIVLYNMDNLFYSNRLKEEIRKRSKHRLMFCMLWVLIFIGFMLVKPEDMYAATLYENTVGGYDKIEGNLNVNEYEFNLGTGLSGTIETIYLNTKRVGINDKKAAVQILCYSQDPSVYGNTYILPGCSFNYYSGGVFAEAALGNCHEFPGGSNGAAYSEKSCQPYTPFQLDPTRYYSIAVTGQGFSGTDFYVETNAGNALPVYRFEGTVAEVPVTLTDISFVSTNESGSLLLVGEEAAFRAEYDPSFYPYILVFYEDIEDTEPTILFEDEPQPALNYRIFTHRYQTQGIFRPIVAIGNEHCVSINSGGTLTGSGCVVQYSDPDIYVTVETEQQRAQRLNINYQSTFTYSKTSDVLVGESIEYNYSLSSNFCPNSTVSGKRLFKGYSYPLSLQDSGIVLPAGTTSSGTIIYETTNQPYSDFVFPYIHIYCSSGNYHDVYLGGSTIKNSISQGVSVYDTNDTRFWLPQTWETGGGSQNFGSGTGYYMAAEKRSYLVGDEVKFKWVFNVDFTVGSVYFYPNVGSGSVKTFTNLTDLTEGKNHYFGYRYNEVGEKQPFIQVRSTTYDSGDSSTYKNIYLGGGQQPDPYEYIFIGKQALVIPGDTNTGAIIGDNGIFSLDSWNFDGFGKTGNPYLDEALSLLRYPFLGIKWLATYIYGLIKQVPPFSLIAEVIAPEPNAMYTTPKYIGDFDISTVFPQETFTITYASEDTAPIWNTLFGIIIAMSLFWYFVHNYFGSSHNNHHK